MKKILLLSTIAAFSIFNHKADAQFHASINIGVQPAWGPSGYDYAENYYLPDVEAYYNVPSRQFVYCNNGNWIYASSLPGRYSNYDLYSGYKVVLNERNPWSHFYNDRRQYSSYRYRHDQVVIRDGRGYGRGVYGGPVFNDRNRGRDRGYFDNRRDNDRRQDWSRNNDRRGEHDHDRRHDDNRGGRGRW